MADDALLERIDSHLARQVTLDEQMRMDHAELRAWMREGIEGTRELSEWIRQMAEEFTAEMRESRREWKQEMRESRREWKQEMREHREAMFRMLDRLDEGGSDAT